ncbi:MAG: hypothetical protein AAB478_03420 [Patescibacteria group bacterium]
MTKGILWIVLIEESKQKLLETVPAKYPVLFANHITLFYDVELTGEWKGLVEKRIELSLKTHCYDHQIQAVTVDIGDLPCQNLFPHITISAQEGIKPFISNAMLQGVHSSQYVKESLQGVVEFAEFE